MDLVLCRNVLIYFTAELQRRALQLFAFALRNGGYLALGKAETIKPVESAFTPAHRVLKLYQACGRAHLRAHHADERYPGERAWRALAGALSQRTGKRVPIRRRHGRRWRY